MGVFSSLARWVRRDVVVEKRPLGPARLIRRSGVLPGLPLYHQFTRIGGGLGPRDVSAIIQEADNGYIHRFVDLLNEARQKDCHLQSLLNTREAALTGLPWKVEPNDAENAQDVEVAAFVERALLCATGIDQEIRSFTDMLAHMAGGIYYGFSISEIAWQREGSNLTIAGFRNTSHRRFRFTLEEGRLAYYDSDSPADARGIDLKKNYSDLFIQHQPRTNGDVPAREGLGRVLAWASLFRNWALSDWMRLAELAYKPWRIGRYEETASNEDINDLVVALDNLTTNGVGVFGKRAEVSVEWPERGRGGKPEHKELADHLGSEMSKCVLGQTLTVEQGERGARSLGEVHDRVRKDLREQDALHLMVTINRDLIEPLVRLNFGTSVDPPKWTLITDDTEDIGNLSRAIEGYVRAGVKLPQWWVRDKLGAPDPHEGDEVCLGKDYLLAENGYVGNNIIWQGEPAPQPEPVESPDDEESDDGEEEIEVDVDDEQDDSDE